MTRMLRWLLFGPLVVLRIGDDGGGGGGGSNEEEEEARKAELRRRIDKLYGVGDDSDARAAAQSMDEENTKLAGATRSYYADKLGEQYGDAERQKRFSLARRKLLGGSEEIFQQGELKEDRDMGATRVDDAVRRAVTGLRNQREQERLSAINLVNSGAGDSAVSAAQAGLRNSFDAAASAQKAALFDDLFGSAVDGLASGNEAARAAALGARYRDRVTSFMNPTRSTSGRITSTE